MGIFADLVKSKDSYKHIPEGWRDNIKGVTEPMSMPGADDLYNDPINFTKSNSAAVIGQDEYGNDIRSNALNDYVESEKEADTSFIGNLPAIGKELMLQSIPGVKVAETIISNRNEIANLGMAVFDTWKNNWGAPITELGKRIEADQGKSLSNIFVDAYLKGPENFIKNSIHASQNATEIEHSQLYENYFYRAEERNAEIKRIAETLGVDEAAFAFDRDTYVKAAKAAERINRLKENQEFLDADGNVDMSKIYKAIPGLDKIQKEKGTAAAALALGNINGIKAINDVYQNDFTRFAGSVYTGALRGYYSYKKNKTYADAMRGGRKLTREEQGAVSEYDSALEQIPSYSYSGAGSVFGAMIGGVAENVPMIA
ncbi:MAG: hypothetical protein RSB52_08655, partial [Acidaminococcaceae bacterium]